ncbi:MAG: hypothetical protein APF76_00455 [Desulfitibacter sp. BRH_c19]|nr:MAG: hypothetical protein APF76_00455 [Desulfitibacter sp. BRH_c19]
MNTGKESNCTAILCLTEKGAQLATRLGEILDGNSVLYIPKRLKDLNCRDYEKQISYFENWQEMFSGVFSSYSKIICIMATGIVVRSLSPLINSKYSDPAVVVVDEKGAFAISLLSGHVGGANSLAKEVASKLSGQVVITTATDVREKPAVDVLAAELNGLALPRENVKLFNRLLVEDKTVYLSSPFPVVPTIKQGFVWRQWPNYIEPAILISPYVQEVKSKKQEAMDVLQILPRNLVVGIGCRKGVTLEDVTTALMETLNKYSFDERCIKSLATIDFKGEEEALKLLSKKMQVPLNTVTKDEINSLEGTFDPSDWVTKQIGVGGVCEPAAKLVAKKGLTIVPKQKVGPVTISMAVEKSWWLDLDQEIETLWLQQPWKL